MDGSDAVVRLRTHPATMSRGTKSRSSCSPAVGSAMPVVIGVDGGGGGELEEGSSDALGVGDDASPSAGGDDGTAVSESSGEWRKAPDTAAPAASNARSAAATSRTCHCDLRGG